MASFASQLLDVFYDLVERVTGYSVRPDDDKGTYAPPLWKQYCSCCSQCYLVLLVAHDLLRVCASFRSADAQKPSKLAFVEKFQAEEVVEIRSRNLPAVSGGSEGQVN